MAILNVFKLGFKGDNDCGLMEEGWGLQVRRTTRGRQRSWPCCDGGRKKEEKAVSEITIFRMGGGNRAGCHRRAVGWTGREAEAQWGEGQQPVKKNKWAAAGPTGRWADWAEREEVFGLDFEWDLANKI
jgi:hypothetical protein